VKAVLRIGRLTVNEVTVSEVTVSEVTVSEVTVSEVTVSEVTVNEVTVNEVTVSEVTATEVIHTEMTGTVTEEAIAIAVVIRIRATVTREAGQHRRHCSSSLSRHHPCVAETTGTEIVVGMLGPGAPCLICYQMPSHASIGQRPFLTL
jgi:hypothetical protein